MNRTQHYQLCQWAAEDPVQRVDFNEDNAKIDAAIRAQADAVAAERSARISAVQSEANARAAAVQAARDACPLVVLRSVTLSSAASRYDLDLTGFDWMAYGEILIYMLVKGSNVKVLLNGLTGSTYYYDTGSGAVDQLAQFSNLPASATCKLLRRNLGFQAEWRDNSYWAQPRYLYFRQEYTPRTDFKTMNFVGSLEAGSKFTILGVRG